MIILQNCLQMKQLVVILIAVFWISCEQLEFLSNHGEKAIVEGYIVAGQKIKLKVTKELVYDSNDTTIQPINNLTIEISDSLTSETLINSGDSGIYVSQNMVAAEGVTYTIEFKYNDVLLKSQTVIPTKPTGFTCSASSITVQSFRPGMGGGFSPPEAITVNWTNAENFYYLVVVECLETNPTPIFDTAHFRPSRMFRNSPMQGTSSQISPMSFSYYGTHRVILFRLNAEYSAIYQENGNNSLNLTAPNSNIENGSGIFTGINSDTLMIEVTN